MPTGQRVKKNGAGRRAVLCVLILLIAAAALTILRETATAQDVITVENPLGRGTTFRMIVERIVKWANALAPILTTLMVLVAGLLYITAGGNMEQVKKAHRALIWAAIGFAVVLLAQVADLIIKNVLGA